MAWRIDRAVIRGEIDNRGRGRGRIWLVGRNEPLERDLQGNCWRDLAGRGLEFSNPNPKAGDLEGLAPGQDGVVGDITASRKVKVPELPLAGPKLAGALNGHYWPPEIDFCAHTIVRLKRARGYLEDALRATESCQEEKLIKPEYLGPIVAELVDFIRETDELIAELRAKLERGTD